MIRRGRFKDVVCGVSIPEGVAVSSIVDGEVTSADSEVISTVGVVACKTSDSFCF